MQYLYTLKFLKQKPIGIEHYISVGVLKLKFTTNLSMYSKHNRSSTIVNIYYCHKRSASKSTDETAVSTNLVLRPLLLYQRVHYRQASYYYTCH